MSSRSSSSATDLSPLLRKQPAGLLIGLSATRTFFAPASSTISSDGAQTVRMRGGRQGGWSVKGDVRLQHHDVSLLDEASHATESVNGGSGGRYALSPVGDGERSLGLEQTGGETGQGDPRFFPKAGHEVPAFPQEQSRGQGASGSGTGNRQVPDELSAIHSFGIGRYGFAGFHHAGSVFVFVRGFRITFEQGRHECHGRFLARGIDHADDGVVAGVNHIPLTEYLGREDLRASGLKGILKTSVFLVEIDAVPSQLVRAVSGSALSCAKQVSSSPSIR